MTEELKPTTELAAIIAQKKKPVTTKKPEVKTAPVTKAKDTTNAKVENGNIDVSKYDLPDLNLTVQSDSNQPVAKPGLLAHWWATKNIGAAQSKGWTPVVGHDTPYLEYPKQYQLCPGTNWLTNDGGQSIIVVCKEADYNAQVEKRALDYFKLTVPGDIQITK